MRREPRLFGDVVSIVEMPAKAWSGSSAWISCLIAGTSASGLSDFTRTIRFCCGSEPGPRRRSFSASDIARHYLRPAPRCVCAEPHPRWSAEADFFRPMVVVDLFADGVFAGKIFLRERFVDDDRSRLGWHDRPSVKSRPRSSGIPITRK